MIYEGGSGEYFTVHVRLIVLPRSIKRSGPPTTSVTGSVKNITKKEIFYLQKFLMTFQHVI